MAPGALHLFDWGVDHLSSRDIALVMAGEADFPVDEELRIVSRVREMAVRAASIGHGRVAHPLEEGLLPVAIKTEEGRLGDEELLSRGNVRVVAGCAEPHLRGSVLDAALEGLARVAAHAEILHVGRKPLIALLRPRVGVDVAGIATPGIDDRVEALRPGGELLVALGALAVLEFGPFLDLAERGGQRRSPALGSRMAQTVEEAVEILGGNGTGLGPSVVVVRLRENYGRRQNAGNSQQKHHAQFGSVIVFAHVTIVTGGCL